MKILAVIPARAGSKGIPNKNIRIIGDKPMIAYCIENAMRSRYITDIVVSTDSDEIELITNYYGVQCKRRDARLCGDSITLDAVIYDVCKDGAYDYIVTMQPTSPTLKVSSLDKAIEKTISEKWDTVISVVNKPHLAWVERDEKVVPDYTERINRQYLPKRFLETGAFLISNAKVVTEKTRIGERVSVFEVSEDEAVDIDSFQDLLCAEQILKQKKIAIVVNGNDIIGLGHIYRMLELADMLGEKPDFYYCNSKTDRSLFGDTTYPLIPYSDNKDLMELLDERKYDVVINDILDTDSSYMCELQKHVDKIVNFEDAGCGRQYADIVINALYKEEHDDKKFYFGSNYYFAPKLFMLYKPVAIKKETERIFVCFGGADPQNYTEKILNLIKADKLDNKYKFTIVLGKAKSNYWQIIDRYTDGNIEVFYNVKNMPELMSKCDLAITSMGRTCYELASLGIPTMAMAQNEREERHEFVCSENGFSAYGVKIAKNNKMKDAFHSFIQMNESERKAKQSLMLATDLRRGRMRVKNLIDSL